MIKTPSSIAVLQAAVERLDAFTNTLTGQGNATLDKGSAWDVKAVSRVSFAKLKAAYHGGYYTRRIVDLIADDAVVRGWQLLDPSDPDATEDMRWAQVNRRLDIHEVISTALKFSRAYGTGYVVPITYDLRGVDKPLDMSELFEVQDLLVFDPGEVTPREYVSGDSVGFNLTEPASYRINASFIARKFQGRWGTALSGTVDIHPSRVIPIVGHPLSTFDRLDHPFALGDSVLQSMWLALARADAIDGAAAILAQEMKQDVVKIPDLKAIGTSDARDAFELRMQLLKLSKGLLNMVVLGAGEEYESRATPVAGFRDLAQNARDALVAASGISEAILFGKASSGLVTSPGTEQEAYHRKVTTTQVQKVSPALRRIYDMVAAAKAGEFEGDQRYRSIQVRFLPLVPETQKDADARTLIGAQRDSIHAGMISSVDPVLGQQFVRYIVSNRYGPHGWQNELPPFRPEDYPADIPEAVEEGEVKPPKPKVPDGQNPSLKLPQAAETVGFQGVDIQPINTGKGQFDSQACLTEYVMMDADIYDGPTYTLPGDVRSQMRESLRMDGLSDVERRRMQQMADRDTVGIETVRQMAAAGSAWAQGQLA